MHPPHLPRGLPGDGLPGHGRRPALAALCAAAAGALAMCPARAADLPGTPQQSRGAPGSTPGRIDPFGSQGDEALRSPSPAERQAADRRQVLEAIEISGNRRTDGGLIRRLVGISQGEIVTPAAIRAARVRLLQLGTFDHVDVTAARGSRPDLIVLKVLVDERSPFQVTDLSIAHTAVSPAYGSAGLADPVLFGHGVGLWAVGAFGGQGRHAIQLALHGPDVRVAGRSWIAGLRAFYHWGLESGCSTPRCDGRFSEIPWLHYRRLGFELDGGWRPGLFSRFLAGYRLEALAGTSDPGVVATARPVLREGRSTLSALELGYDFDSRNDPLLPSGGTRFEARATISTAALQSDYEYARFLVQLERWFGGGGRALRLDVALGLVQGDAPFFERFYAADWSYFSVGVAAYRALGMNFSPDSRYDVLLAVAGLEYDSTIWESRPRFLKRGILALGTRFVYSAATAGAGRSALSATPVSIDLALRVETRLGVVSIGLGYVTDQVLKLVPLSVPGIERRQ